MICYLGRRRDTTMRLSLTFFDHLENMFLGGGVYVTPPFDLDNQDYLRPTLLFSTHSETIK
jgi:hypothetical protein